jgi:hypothetical protein
LSALSQLPKSLETALAFDNGAQHKSTFAESVRRLPVLMQSIDNYRVGKPNAVIAFSQRRDYTH